MNERYNPFANMTQVPRSEPIRNGVIGPAMEYSNVHQEDFFNPFNSIQEPQVYTESQEVYVPNGYNCMSSGVNFSDIQQMAFSALDEIDAKNELLAEREDPEILMAFQGVCSGIKHQDIQASQAPVVFSEKGRYIPINNSEPQIFGYYDNFSKKEESSDKKEVLDIIDNAVENFKNENELIKKLKNENLALKNENLKLKAKLYEILEQTKPDLKNLKSVGRKSYENVGALFKRVKK